ncbi:MAG: HAD-IA family hydrolase [Candidatus Omnitrophica bacterium]|nr:HAD-IA family hydrolase [Candidatus Omnitrophota bacterium]
MDLKKKKLLIYDLDGTLIDTREDIALSANAMRTGMGMPPLEHEKIYGYVGWGLHYLVEKCLETQDQKMIEKGGKIYRDYYARHMLDHARPYSGAREFLDAHKGAHQVVITNKPDPYTSDMLEALALTRYFFRIIPGNGDYPHKPDPASTLDMIRICGVEASEVLWIGDSTIDIETARASGVPIAVVTHGFADKRDLENAGPDILAHGFHQLMEMGRHEQW